MRVERLLGVLNGFGGCEANKKSKIKSPTRETSVVGHQSILGLMAWAARPLVMVTVKFIYGHGSSLHS